MRDTEGGPVTPPVKLLLIFVNEVDLWEGMPLADAIVHRLMRLNVAGATAHVGALGFGRHMPLHHKGLFGIADDRPVTITAVDEEQKIRKLIPEIRGMVIDGVILLLDAELIAEQPAT
jgi:PII-like signaling protein